MGLECGGRIDAPTRISTPGNPFTVAPNMNCMYFTFSSIFND